MAYAREPHQLRNGFCCVSVINPKLSHEAYSSHSFASKDSCSYSNRTRIPNGQIPTKAAPAFTSRYSTYTGRTREVHSDVEAMGVVVSPGGGLAPTMSGLKPYGDTAQVLLPFLNCRFWHIKTNQSSQLLITLDLLRSGLSVRGSHFLTSRGKGKRPGKLMTPKGSIKSRVALA